MRAFVSKSRAMVLPITLPLGAAVCEPCVVNLVAVAPHARCSAGLLGDGKSSTVIAQLLVMCDAYPDDGGAAVALNKDGFICRLNLAYHSAESISCYRLHDSPFGSSV